MMTTVMAAQGGGGRERLAFLAYLTWALLISEFAVTRSSTSTGPSGVIMVFPLLLMNFWIPGLLVATKLAEALEVDWLDALVVAFYGGYVVSGIVLTALLPLPRGIRGPVYLAIQLAILAYLLPSRVSELWNALKRRTAEDLSWGLDAVVLSALVLLRAIAIVFAYPGLGLKVGSDWGRHYAAAGVLWSDPLLYHGTYPPFLRIHLSAFIGLGMPDVGALGGSLALIASVMFPLDLYVLGRAVARNSRYLRRELGNYVKYFPILFTLLFDFSARSGGFEWLAYLTRGLTIKRIFWYLSGLFYGTQHMSLALLAVSMFLIIKLAYEGEPGTWNAGCLILSAFVYSLYLTHIAEALLLGFSILAVQIMERLLGARSGLTAGRVSGSIALGLGLALVSLSATSILLPLFQVRRTVLFLTTGILLAYLLLAATGGRDTSVGSEGSSPTTSISRVCRSLVRLAPIFVIFYAFSLLTWVRLAGEGAVVKVDSIQIVPWYEYPALLGVTGLVAVIEVLVYLRKMGPERHDGGGAGCGALPLDAALILFLSISVMSIFAGKVSSFLSKNYFTIGFPEVRNANLARVMLAPWGALGVLRLARGASASRRSFLRRGLPLLVALLFIFYEATPTLAGTVGWIQRAESGFDREELAAMGRLRDILARDAGSYVLSMSIHSRVLSAAAGAPFLLVPKADVINVLDERRPETSILVAHKPSPATHPYLIITQYDPREGFFSDLVSLFRPIELNPRDEGPEVLAYSLPKMHVISPDSDAVLALPIDDGIVDNPLMALAVGLLSAEGLDFTTALDVDPAIFNASLLILPYDPPDGTVRRRVLHGHERDAGRFDVSGGRPGGVGGVAAGLAARRGWEVHVPLKLLEEYIASGGSVVILNLNGQGHYTSKYLSHHGLLGEGGSAEVTGLEGLCSANLTFSVRQFGDNCTLIEPSTGGSAFGGLSAIACRRGRGRVVLVNVSPVARRLVSEGASTSVLACLGEKVLRLLELSGIRVERKDGDRSSAAGISYFKQIWLANSSIRFSSAVLLPAGERLEIVSRDGGEVAVTLENASFVGLCGSFQTDFVEVTGVSGNSLAGSAFYFPMEFQSVPMRAESPRWILTCSCNGSVREIKLPGGDYTIAVKSNGSAVALLRRPIMTSVGPARFSGVYNLSFVPFHPAVIDGRDVAVEFPLRVRIELVDSWVGASLEYDEAHAVDWELHPPLVEIDTEKVLRAAVFSLLLLLPLAVSIPTFAASLKATARDSGRRGAGLA